MYQPFLFEKADILNYVLAPSYSTWDKVKNVFSPRTYGMWDVGANGRITGATPRGGTAPTPGKAASLGAGRAMAKGWLKNASTLKRGQLIKDIESVGFKKIYEGKGMMKFNRGKMTIRLDPPQGKTLYNHMHLSYGKEKSTYDIF